MVDSFLLLETGDFVLLETGDKIILEDGAPAQDGVIIDGNHSRQVIQTRAEPTRIKKREIVHELKAQGRISHTITLTAVGRIKQVLEALATGRLTQIIERKATAKTTQNQTRIAESMTFSRDDKKADHYETHAKWITDGLAKENIKEKKKARLKKLFDAFKDI